ncbi:MAG: sigma-54-dependent Fis family transcriptional regulator [Acidobacteria bacterium]|nr:sigma-54-dependent Fis family transcriptional regulator [Acidobacteriota bacterium]
MRTATYGSVSFVGSSAAARQVMADVETAARSEAKVLITGETGVGKDVVARLLHLQSARRHTALSAINCAGMPDTLLESELFGHVRGSFTGAFRDKVGLLEAADRGTAFLDEAGEMSARMQGVLLRFLETGEVQRVGSERGARVVNVRIIAATNRDLLQQVGAGAFREDLYYRLNVIRIHVPPLRQRAEDVPLLFEHFVRLFSLQYDVAPRALTREAAEVLMAYRWPGNVRELKNLVEQLVVRAPGEAVRSHDLPAELQGPVRVATTAADGTVAGEDGPEALARELVRRMLSEGASFWTVVHQPFMERDLSRQHVRAVVRAGLEQTLGNYRMLVELFNMQQADYKRFLGFLRKHDCHVPFHPFRVARVPASAVAGAPRVAYREAAGM